MKSLWKSFRNLAPQFLLKGPLMRLWLARLTAQLAAEYGRFLLRERPRQNTPPVRKTTSVRRLLFVCANMWEQRELLPELRKLCEVDFLDVNPFRLASRFEREDRLDLPRLLPRIPDQRYDATVVYLNSALLSAELLQAVRSRTDGPLLGLNLDDKTTYTTYSVFQKSAQDYRRWASSFDCNLTNSRALKDVYNDEGFPCLYLPTGFHYDPEIHHFDPGVSFEFEMSFVGSCKPERKLFIQELQRQGIPVKIFGGGWPGASFTNEGAAVFRKTQINLGIGYNLPGMQFTNLKNRDFECPGSGGCYLTTFDWELSELFEVGQEILCYRNIYDFIEVYSQYRRRPDRCREIARAGFLRSVSEHTWAHRFETVFRELGLQAKPLPTPPFILPFHS